MRSLAGLPTACMDGMLFRPKLSCLSYRAPRLRILLRCGLASPCAATTTPPPLHRIFFLLRPTTRKSVCITAIP